MKKGKWYLVYTETNEMEAGTFRDGVEDVEVPLKAITENDAVAEARTKWNIVVAEATTRWEEQKKTWREPPASPSEWGPRKPRVIYNIPLE